MSSYRTQAWGLRKELEETRERLSKSRASHKKIIAGLRVELADIRAAVDEYSPGLLAAQPATTARPWPDPEAYRALACEVFGEAGPPKDVAPAVAAWKALADGQRVMCSRGYQWTARRADGRLRFTMAKADGRPGKTVEQPWYPCIMARLPVWPIVIEAAD